MRVTSHNDIEQFGFSEAPSDHQPDRQLELSLGLIAIVALAGIAVSLSQGLPAWIVPLLGALHLL